MRRRQKEARAIGGGTIPAWLDDFDPSAWPGGSDYQRWEAWEAARQEWAAANLPGGAEQLQSHSELIPDQPWSEVKHLI